MGKAIKVGIIGGSGLDNPDIIKNRTEKRVTTPFGDPTDVLILGEIEGVPCVLLPRHGRKHDKMPGAINYPANIWAFKEEGCTHLVATNACGSLDESIRPGSLVLVDGFIDRTTNRKQTFYDGECGHPPGICHMPMEPAFHPKLGKVIMQTACRMGLKIRNGGCVVAIEGPRYSSKAEVLLYKSWGGQLVGMTTVPEVVLAKEAGLMYAVIAMATDTGDNVSHNEVLRVFQDNVEAVLKLVKALIPEIAKENWDSEIKEMEDLVKDSVVLPK